MNHFKFNRHLKNINCREARLIFEHDSIDKKIFNDEKSIYSSARDGMMTPFANNFAENWNDNIPNEEKIYMSTAIEEIKSYDGAEMLIAHFSDANPESITEEQLKAYISTNIGLGVTTFLDKLFTDRTDANSAVRLEADKKIGALVLYLNKRRQVLSDTKNKLQSASEDKELPTPAHQAWEITKNIAGGFMDGFNASSGKEKLVMIAGAVTAYIALSRLVQSHRYIKNAAGVMLGTGVLVAAIGALNKSIEKTTGRPLFTFDPKNIAPVFTESQEQWDAAKHEKELEAEWKKLSQNSIPVEEITEMVSEDKEKRKYAFAIANICALSMKEFEALYKNHQSAKSIPNSKAPSTVFYDDHLTATERFNLVEEIANDMQLLDSTSKNWKWGAQKHLENKGVLTAIYEAIDTQ